MKLGTNHIVPAYKPGNPHPAIAAVCQQILLCIILCIIGMYIIDERTLTQPLKYTGFLTLFQQIPADMRNAQPAFCSITHFHDVALQKLHVVLGVDRAGLVGADGETHHGCFDALFLSEIPGFTVLCPASFAELRRMLRQALFEIDGPVAVRYPRGGEGDYREDRSGAPVVRLREGEDVTLLTYGVLVNQALAAADLLERQGVRTEVLKLNQISPLEYETLAPWLAGKKLLAVAEDAFGAGCVGQRTAAILAQHGQAPEKLVLINLGKTFLPEGAVPQLEHQAGIDAAGIARAVQEART